MDHEDWLELISAEADGELDAADSARLAQHLATCSSCTQLLAGFATSRRRARVRTEDHGGHLVAAIAAERDRDHREAARARSVLVRRCTAAAVGVAAAVIALVVATSGTTSVAPIVPRDAADALIAANDRSFDRADIEVPSGTTVEWRNAGTHTHHLVREFDGVTLDEDLPPGRTETATFDRPGTFDYYCTIHPEMTGTVTVDA